jgi:hypothetical protein
MTYQYQSLPVITDSEDIYIRLLRLPPGPRSGAITCSIFSTRLSEAPEFEAVSYCWGPSLDGDTIYVTNKNDSKDSPSHAALKVPGSIVPFLYRTRGHRIPRERTFWIDSICINQQDPEEKNIQVPKMRNIYLKAESTVSWLGPERARSTEAFAYARELNKLHRKEMAKLGVWTLPEEEMKESNNTKVTLGDPDLEALFHVLERPYFERAWIVQEVVVSERISLVCGDAVINWQIFIGAFFYLATVTQWVWEFYPGHRLQYLFTLKLSENDWDTSKTIHWSRVLLRHRMHKATDPRDKVYAYYGLRCKDGFHELGIKPDYKNTTMESLFTRLATNALRAGQWEVLHVPRIVFAPAEEGTDADLARVVLPSWAPDWRWTIRTPDAFIGGNEDGGVTTKYRASCDSALNIEFDIPPDVVQNSDGTGSTTLPKLLRLRGLRMARITHTTATWRLQQPTGRQTLFEQARVLQENQLQIIDWEKVMRPSQASKLYAPTGGTRMAAFYETLMAGTPLYSQADKDAAATGFERRQRVLRLIPTLCLHNFIVIYCILILSERFLRLFGYMNPEIKFRTMVGDMINRKGARLVSEADANMEYLALMPGLCGLGDYVVLAEGVRMPLVLRPKGQATVPVDGAQSESKVVDTWELIGDCYVHGATDGEVWKKRADECEDLWIA